MGRNEEPVRPIYRCKLNSCKDYQKKNQKKKKDNLNEETKDE